MEKLSKDIETGTFKESSVCPNIFEILTHRKYVKFILNRPVHTTALYIPHKPNDHITHVHTRLWLARAMSGNRQLL